MLVKNYPLGVEFRYESEPLLWTIDNVYSKEECYAFIEKIESANPGLASNNPMYRNQDRVIIDSFELAGELFNRIKDRLPNKIGEFELLSINERFRFYRYKPGQSFTPHMDHWYQANDTDISLLTVLVYFNDDFTGGQTRFSEQIEEVVEPVPGRVAVFQHKLRHEGCKVISGTKYAVRTEVIYRKTNL